MRQELKELFISGCDEKINKKGISVGLYFFKNKNKNPELLMEAVT